MKKYRVYISEDGYTVWEKYIYGGIIKWKCIADRGHGHKIGSKERNLTELNLYKSLSYINKANAGEADTLTELISLYPEIII